MRRSKKRGNTLAVRVLGAILAAALTWLGFWATKHAHGASVLLLIVILPACLVGALGMIGVLLGMPIDWFTHDWETIHGYMVGTSPSNEDDSPKGPNPPCG